MKDIIKNKIEDVMNPNCNLQKFYETSIDIDYNLYKKIKNTETKNNLQNKHFISFNTKTYKIQQIYNNPMDLDAINKKQLQ